MTKHHKWESQSILGWPFDWTAEERQVNFDESMQLHMAPGKAQLRPVEWMKSKLGRQDYTWVGEFRYWVWERSDWRVFVSNTKGICFEVKKDLTKQQVREQWIHFRVMIGLT